MLNLNKHVINLSMDNAWTKKLWVSVAGLALLVGATLPSGTYAATVKCPNYSGKAVKVKQDYWVVENGQRLHAIDRDAVITWGKTIAVPGTACAAKVLELPETGVLGYRSGTRLIRKVGTGGVFAVGSNGTIHPISNPTIAAQWYGRSWLRLVKVVSAELFDKMTIGSPVTLEMVNDGVVVRQSGRSQLYLVRGGQLVKVTGRVPYAVSSNARVLATAVFKKLSLSAETVAAADLIKITLPSVADSSTTTEVPASTNGNTSAPAIEVINNPAKKVPEAEFTGANYTGPFPAPEGLVLEGYIGSNTFKQPTGAGAYRFVLKTESKRSINCLDSTRTVWKSKGVNYDAGFKAGIAYGIKDGENIFVKYNDTPRGAGNTSNNYFAEGFRVGYKHGYEVGDDFGVYYNCVRSEFDLSKYDADGWRVTTNLSRAPNVKSIAAPEGAPDTGKLNPQGYSWSFVLSDSERFEEQELNKGKAPVNLSRIEFVEATPDASEASLSMEQVARMSYDSAAKYVATKYNRICALTEPNIETKTYGSNTVTNLSFVQVCEPEAGKITWKLQAYSFLRGKNSGNVLTVTFIDPFDIKKAGVNEFNTEKLPSVDFIAQFLSKIQFN